MAVLHFIAKNINLLGHHLAGMGGAGEMSIFYLLPI